MRKLCRRLSWLKPRAGSGVTKLRLHAYNAFVKRPHAAVGRQPERVSSSMTSIYYIPAHREAGALMDEVPDDIRNTFERLGIH